MYEWNPNPNNNPPIADKLIYTKAFFLSPDFLIASNIKYDAHTIKNGAMIARKPIRENMICHALVAKRKLERSAKR